MRMKATPPGTILPSVMSRAGPEGFKQSGTRTNDSFSRGVLVVPAVWPRSTPVPRVATRLTLSASPRVLCFRVEDSGVCFERKFLPWHAICTEKPAMLKAQLSKHDTDLEPAPEFANGAETSLAEQLRLQVEERSFGHTVTPTLLLGRLEKDH